MCTNLQVFMFSNCKTSTNLPTPMPNIAGVEQVTDINTEETVTPSTSDNGGGAGGDANNLRELQETPKPQAKTPGKKCSQKSEVQNHILDLLERENAPPEEDDPVELMFSGIAKRVKKNLPEDEAFTLIHTLQGTINEHIKKYKRMKVVEETSINPTSFMREGVTEVVQVLQMETLQAATPTIQEAPPPPPMIRAVHPVNPVQVQVQPQVQGVQNHVYYQREVPFEEM